MKKNSNEWSRIFDDYFHVAEMEGWGRNVHYAWFEEKIDLNEFILRMMASTCFFKKDWSEINKFIQTQKEFYEC